MSFGVQLDRDGLLFDLYVSYVIDGYSDPETGEYFGDTSWTLTIVDLDAATSGSIGGFAAESETVTVSLGLGPDLTLQAYRIELSALNTFSGVTAFVEVGVQSAANATGAQSITGGAGAEALLGGAGPTRWRASAARIPSTAGMPPTRWTAAPARTRWSAARAPTRSRAAAATTPTGCPTPRTPWSNPRTAVTTPSTRA